VANNKQRLARLEDLISQAHRQIRRRGSNICKGKTLQEIFDIVESKVDVNDPVVVETYNKVQAFADVEIEDTERDPVTCDYVRGADGKRLLRRHGYDEFLHCLRFGHGLLPDKLPLVFWRSYCDLHVGVFLRCESCKCVFGNAVPVGPSCPACDTGEIWQRCLGTHKYWKPINRVEGWGNAPSRPARRRRT
jgi:hypothetical protein